MNDEEHTIETAFKKVPCSDIKEGVRFSDAVYFDDGESMFLAQGKPAKAYHVECLVRWKVPFLLCCGRMLGENEPFVPPATEEELEEPEELGELGEVDALEEEDAAPVMRQVLYWK